VGRPHGLDGSFYVREPDLRLLAAGRTVLVGGAARVIERRAGTDARPIVRLEGVGSRDAAAALGDAPLLVPVRDAPALAEGEFWAHELEGLAVVDGSREVGVVRRLVGLPSCEALEVSRADGGADLLIPLVRDAIRSVDISGGRVDVRMSFLGA
jgi:16S rRNA processing protein RimM